MNNFENRCLSASDLVKRSALQIRFLRMKRQSIITRRMLAGVQYQNQVAVEQKAEDAQEYRTTVQVGDLVIFACHDIITPDYCMEVKSITPGSNVEDWYLESSLLQTAFYKSLLMCSDGYVCTPKFRIKEGYNKKTLLIDKNLPYILKMGESSSWEVTTLYPEKIIQYFAEKGKVTFGDELDCRKYDRMHKFKHFKECRNLFEYTKL